MRYYSLRDQVCLGVDQVVRTLMGQPKSSGRPSPVAELPETNMTTPERQHAAALMRVNHAGEVAAQALYQAQGLVSRSATIKAQMHAAAIEEGDHLAWCQQRTVELGGHTSYLGPFWYMGSFAIGALAGAMGDRWSLGFLAETEQQVVNHLEGHLQRLPANDLRSYAILKQMQDDETNHRNGALAEGAIELPQGVKKIMGFFAKIMVKTAYWV